MNKEQFLKELNENALDPHASSFAYYWHTIKHNQKRYMGEDYFSYHLIPVVDLIASKKEWCGDHDIKTVGYLHDILEDTDCTEELLREFFPKDVVDDVVLLTHIRTEPREVYYHKIKTSSRALTVKMADVAHNISCLTNLTDLELRDRLAKKYMKAIKCLMIESEE